MGGWVGGWVLRQSGYACLRAQKRDCAEGCARVSRHCVCVGLGGRLHVCVGGLGQSVSARARVWWNQSVLQSREKKGHMSTPSQEGGSRGLQYSFCPEVLEKVFTCCKFPVFLPISPSWVLHLPSTFTASCPSPHPTKCHYSFLMSCSLQCHSLNDILFCIRGARRLQHM